ncbi:MAG: hypothetical protein Kow0069_12630 [Promethearchaeota archaeon]
MGCTTAARYSKPTPPPHPSDAEGGDAGGVATKAKAATTTKAKPNFQRVLFDRRKLFSFELESIGVILFTLSFFRSKLSLIKGKTT